MAGRVAGHRASISRTLALGPVLLALTLCLSGADRAQTPSYVWALWGQSGPRGSGVLALVDVRDARPVLEFTLAVPERGTDFTQLLCLGEPGTESHLCVLTTRHELWPRGQEPSPDDVFKSITSAIYTVDLERMTVGRRLHSWPYEIWKAVAIPARSLLFTAGMDGKGGFFHRRYDFSAGWESVTDTEGLELSYCAVSPDSEYIWTIASGRPAPYVLRRTPLVASAQPAEFTFPDVKWWPGHIAPTPGEEALADGYWDTDGDGAGEVALFTTDGADDTLLHLPTDPFWWLGPHDSSLVGVWVLTALKGPGSLELRPTEDGATVNSIALNAVVPYGPPRSYLTLHGGRVLGLVWAADTHNPGLLAFADTSTREVVYMDMTERWLLDAVEADVTPEQVAAMQARAAQLEQTAGE